MFAAKTATGDASHAPCSPVLVAGGNVAMTLERRYWSSVEITNKVRVVRKLVETPTEGDEAIEELFEGVRLLRPRSHVISRVVT
jgi:hypothetical protein